MIRMGKSIRKILVYIGMLHSLDTNDEQFDFLKYVAKLFNFQIKCSVSQLSYQM